MRHLRWRVAFTPSPPQDEPRLAAATGALFPRRAMPRKRPELVLLTERVAIAREIVAEQQAVIAKLAESGQSTVEAEKTLQTYLSALRHLEDHARKMRTTGKNK